MMYQNQTIRILHKTPNFLILWSFFLLLFIFIILLIISFKFEKKLYYPGFITKIGNEYYVKIYSKENEVGELNRSWVMINEKKYALTYTTIKEAYTVDETLEIYHEVYLKVKLPKELCIENNKVEVLFSLGRSSWLDTFIQSFKKGAYETIRS